MQPLYDRMKYADLGDFKEQLMEYVEWIKAVSAYLPLDSSYLRSEAMITAPQTEQWLPCE